MQPRASRALPPLAPQHNDAARDDQHQHQEQDEIDGQQQDQRARIAERGVVGQGGIGGEKRHHRDR